MENADEVTDLVGDDVSYDYPESEEIGGVTWNENGTVDVEVKEEIVAQPDANPDYSSDLSPEEQAFLESILQEQLAQQDPNLEQGRTR